MSRLTQWWKTAPNWQRFAVIAAVLIGLTIASNAIAPVDVPGQ